MEQLHGTSGGVGTGRLEAKLLALAAGLALAALPGCNGANSSGGSTPTGGGVSSTPGGTTDPGTTEDPASGRHAALAIGLARVDPGHYGGWSGPLAGCEPDAHNMRRIATQAGLEARMLLTEQATRQGVLDAIAAEAAVMRAGDLFVISYSGHGGQVPDYNGDDPEDGLDETWCLYDGQLIDDELYVALGDFDPGVRVLVFSDSCHSGTVLRVIAPDFGSGQEERRSMHRARFTERGRPQLLTMNAANVTGVREASAPAGEVLDPEQLTYRAMPPDPMFATLDRNRSFYEQIGSAAPAQARANVKCQALLVSGCEDDEYSADLGPAGGLFTVELLRTWGDGAFQGDHRAFQQAIRQAVLARNPTQSPDFTTVGVPISGFAEQRPYTKEAPLGN